MPGTPAASSPVQNGSSSRSRARARSNAATRRPPRHRRDLSENIRPGRLDSNPGGGPPLPPIFGQVRFSSDEGPFPELRQRALLDAPHAPRIEAHDRTDLRPRTTVAVVQSEPQPQDVPFGVIQEPFHRHVDGVPQLVEGC